MFAVPGWSLSPALLKQQVEDASTKPASRKSKKRKRGTAEPVVTDENVSELWNAHHNGSAGQVSRTDDQARSDSTKPQTGSASEVTQIAKSGGKGEEDHAQRPEHKKQKSNKGQHTSVKEDNGLAPPKAVKNDAAAVKGQTNTVVPKQAQLTPLQSAMRQKLVSARFRHLNQTLYTAPSTSSLELFSTNPEMFDDYHSGFRQQVSVWPENPVDIFIQQLRQRAKVKPPKFSRHKRGPPKTSDVSSQSIEPLVRTQGTCTIADLGCGDARLTQELTADKTARRSKLKILSYDLQSNSPHVTKADVANLPLPDGSVDVAVFCLALMGTNWIDFIEEAYRVLHWKGELWIAEIKSRFGRAGGEKPKSSVVGHSVGSKKKQATSKKAIEAERTKRSEQEDEAVLKTEVDGEEKRDNETDVSAFLAVLTRRGFVLKKGNEESIDLSNKMFVRLELIKGAKPTVGKNVPTADIDRKEKPDGESIGRSVKKPLKFLDAPQVSLEQEAAVLKPCLYKIR